jgi:hypothetical protein
MTNLRNLGNDKGTRPGQEIGCLCLNFHTIAGAAVNGFLRPGALEASGVNRDSLISGARQYSRSASFVVGQTTEAV